MKQTDKHYLYRYQPFNVQTMKIFTLNEVYFCSPKELNDPFDCKVDFTFDGCTDDDIRKFLEKGLKELNRESEIDKSFEYALNNKTLWQQNAKKQAIEILQPDIDKMGVLCFSEYRDDILMWAHYSDGHKGFCLEFDKVQLKAWKFCRPVNYDEEYLSFKEFNEAFPDNEKSLQQLLLRKSAHWKYEAEWRIIVNPYDNHGNRSYTFPEEILTGVIFGCNMSDNDKKSIRSCIKGRKNRITFYQAKKKENEFGLDIEEID
ncbi:MAG: DUF2971 domain-containing protein [Nitrospirota bacterium]